MVWIEGWLALFSCLFFLANVSVEVVCTCINVWRRLLLTSDGSKLFLKSFERSFNRVVFYMLAVTGLTYQIFFATRDFEVIAVVLIMRLLWPALSSTQVLSCSAKLTVESMLLFTLTSAEKKFWLCCYLLFLFDGFKDRLLWNLDLSFFDCSSR